MSTPPLAFDGEWTISQAAALHEQLRNAVATGQLHWDLSHVTECDSAGIQLLLAARHSAQAQGNALVINPASAALQSSLQRYGLGHLLTA